MMKLRISVVITAIIGLSTLAFPADFKPYPGAKLDEKASKDATQASRQADPSLTAVIYTTSDPFSKVASFYKGLGTEYAMPMSSGTSGKPKKRSGYDLWEAYFILDGAQDLAGSRLWVKVQNPAIGLYADDTESTKIREITVIILSQKK
jgi:hypothetical protein